MKNVLLLILIFTGSVISAQQRIDSSFPFQTDPNKKYSIYVPSSYVQGTPINLMLGFHPLNTSRWDAESWCDTLIDFAEANNLLLVCPDGGADGKVDDAIDTAFTTELLDSMDVWYTINHQRKYIMGFSWGGLTTYKYGLSNAQTFAGFMPIGAAINGTTPINSILSNANGKGFYVVHGANDSPSSRYTPLINGLTSNNAILNSKLMPGVGHTIDFPNRNQILTTAYLWLDSVRTTQISNVSIEELESNVSVYPTVISQSQSSVTIKVMTSQIGSNIYLVNEVGQVIFRDQISELNFKLEIPSAKGVYFLQVENQQGIIVKRLIRL
jgi:predicted esterase